MEVQDHLVAQARRLVELFRTAYPAVQLRHVPAADNFMKTYQAALPEGGGVYLIRTNDEVIYIGKAVNGFWRIWSHTGIPKSASEDQPPMFSDCRFVVDTTLIHVTPELKSKFLNGDFYIDYIVISPAELAAALETFFAIMVLAHE